jgi:hypothetical protein
MKTSEKTEFWLCNIIDDEESVIESREETEAAKKMGW